MKLCNSTNRKKQKIISINNIGFTLIELLSVIIILAIIALIATPIIIGLIDEARKEAFKDTGYGIIESAEFLYTNDILKGTNEVVSFSYVNGEETSNPSGKQLNYNGNKPKTGVITLNDKGKVAIAIYDGKYCVSKSYHDRELIISDTEKEDCLISLPNDPVLVQGMTPIKWNGTEWVNTTEGDEEWYNYTSNDKKWANARTADGSFWVWIPRYIYKITSGWHSNEIGTIKAQFSKGIDDNWNSSVIGSIDTGITANASNNKWTNHPAFKFGSDELTGIWVAKFEATASEGVATIVGTCNATDNVTTKTVKIVSNVNSWRCIQIGNAFEVSRNMETNSVYGWGTTGNNIDTHLMKNSEWGAVAYLSKSIYGTNTEEIWINPSDNYTTGCAGDSVSSGLTSGCLRTYDTSNGVKASSTGNIYGVYDMSGGSWDRVSAYVDNGNAILSQYGLSILNALAKYKDVYTLGASDTRQLNYESILKKGDALYETSSTGENFTSWFDDYSSMPFDINPWITRGGKQDVGVNGGVFGFASPNGNPNINNSFRPVLLVGEGL